MRLNKQFKTLAAVAGLALAAGSANGATLTGQLGILDLAANSGNNPNTGVAWAENDTYRLVFVTTTTANTLSTAIGDYNTLVQADANASSLNLSPVTWKAVGSTSTVNAIDNTMTNTGAANGAFFLVDGMTVVANNISTGGFWASGHLAAINLDQNGNTRSVDVNVGSTNGGGLANGNKAFGNEADGDARVTIGRSGDAGNSWNYVLNSGNTGARSFYGMSEVLTVATVAAVPEPSSTALLGLGGLALMFRRKR
jgi:hypothetical protein